MEELLDSLAAGRSVHVLGHSLGAAVAAGLAAQAPNRVDRLVLAAPLVDFTANLAAARLLAAPLLGELLTWGYVVPMLRRRRSKRYRDLDGGVFVGRFMRQLEKPGFGRALLSMFRSGTLGNQGRVYEALSSLCLPMLVMRGSVDDILPAEQAQMVLNLLPEARYAEIPDTPHSFILTHPQRVAPVVLDFLTSPEENPAPVAGQSRSSRSGSSAPRQRVDGSQNVSSR
jgi:4,5:9,10-diseco-3-hydroxy-5,9,17-trioxoandrosta-1(10),2-diene-4-oate hydrolase